MAPSIFLISLTTNFLHVSYILAIPDRFSLSEFFRHSEASMPSLVPPPERPFPVSLSTEIPLVNQGPAPMSALPMQSGSALRSLLQIFHSYFSSYPTQPFVSLSAL